MFNDMQISADIKTMTDLVVKNFLRLEKAREVEQQRAVFHGERDITNVLTPAQEEARFEGKEFEPDLERAEDHAKTKLKFGVGRRLQGAYACYKAGMQLECLRHILLALDTVCCALSWDKASAYINEQNRILLEMSKGEREAA